MRNVVILLACAGTLWFSLSGAQSPLGEETPLPSSARPGSALMLNLAEPIVISAATLTAGRPAIAVARERRGRFTFVGGHAVPSEEARSLLRERPSTVCVLNVDGDFDRNFELSGYQLIEEVLSEPRRSAGLKRHDVTLVMAFRDFAWERPSLRQITVEISYRAGAFPAVTPRTLRECLGPAVHVTEVPAAKAHSFLPYRLTIR